MKKEQAETLFIAEMTERLEKTREELRSLKDLPPFEYIERAAKAFNIELNEAKENCKNCHGRGYTGFQKGENIPIPCSCIMPTMTKETKLFWENRSYVPRNRKERRLYEKLLRKQK